MRRWLILGSSIAVVAIIVVGSNRTNDATHQPLQPPRSDVRCRLDLIEARLGSFETAPESVAYGERLRSATKWRDQDFALVDRVDRRLPSVIRWDDYRVDVREVGEGSDADLARHIRLYLRLTDRLEARTLLETTFLLESDDPLVVTISPLRDGVRDLLGLVCRRSSVTTTLDP